MGIYVKNQKLPEYQGAFIELRIYKDGSVEYQDETDAWIKDRNAVIEIDIPHGRLIDAAMLVNKAYYEEQAMPESMQFGVTVDWLVGKTPSVIEEEYE